MGFILLLILLVMLVGSVPTWSHSRDWGYRPSGLFSLLIIILIVLLITGRI